MTHLQNKLKEEFRTNYIDTQMIEQSSIENKIINATKIIEKLTDKFNEKYKVQKWIIKMINDCNGTRRKFLNSKLIEIRNEIDKIRNVMRSEIEKYNLYKNELALFHSLNNASPKSNEDAVKYIAEVYKMYKSPNIFNGYDIENIEPTYEKIKFEKKIVNGVEKYCIKTVVYEDGSDSLGFDKHGFNVEGYNLQGYNIHGYDIHGYDIHGYDIHGYDKNGFDADGYNKDGYNDLYMTRNNTFLFHDIYGYNIISKVHILGYDEKGYDVHGFNKDGVHKKGFLLPKYDKDGKEILQTATKNGVMINMTYRKKLKTLEEIIYHQKLSFKDVRDKYLFAKK